MYYICQLKDGYMFACVDKGVYRVVNTGYPYPDTPYPADTMLRNMLKALGISTTVKHLDVPAMQVLLQPYANGEDIPADTLRNILTGKTDKPVSTTSAVFFRSKNIAVYYISNAKYCTCLRNIIRSGASVAEDEGNRFLELPNEAVFVLIHSKDESKLDGLRVVKRDTLQEFKQFNEGIKAYNILRDGVDFYEEIATGFESVFGKSVMFKPCVIRMNNHTYREAGTIVLGFIYNALALSLQDGNLAKLLSDVGRSIYKDYPDIKEPISLSNSSKTSLTCKTENHIYASVYRLCKFSPKTEEHLDRHVRSCLAFLYHRQTSSFNKLIDRYAVSKEVKKVVLLGNQSFDCMKDYRNSSNRYRDFVDLVLQQRRDMVRFDKEARILVSEFLGSNFTSYEQRLFQYVVVYSCMFRYSNSLLIDKSKAGYSTVNNWVDRVMPFMYENYKRKYLLGGFEFNNSSDFMRKEMSTTYAGKDRIDKGIIIPDLFRDLELDNFNGRQLTDDEILFLHAFMFLFDSDVKATQKGEGLYRIKMNKSFFSYRSRVKDNIITLPQSILPVLKEFMKIDLLFLASALSIEDFNTITEDGSVVLDARTISIGELLYVDGVLNNLSDKNFKMTVGEGYVSMIMYMEG